MALSGRTRKRDEEDGESSSPSAYSEESTSESGEESPSSEVSEGGVCGNAAGEGEEGEEGEEEGLPEQPHKTVNVAFDFAQPSESDFQSLKALLNSYAPSPTFPLSALVDAVISAPSATVIRATQVFDGGDDEEGGDGGDDSSVVGVGAVLRNGGSLLRGMFTGTDLPRPKKAERLFTDEHHVVVIERLMNSPPQLGGPLLGAIFEGTNLPEGKGKQGKKEGKRQGNVDVGKYVVVGKAYMSGGERGYALPEFGCLAEDGVAGEVLWVGNEENDDTQKKAGVGAQQGRCVRFVAVVEGATGVADWERIVEASCCC